MRYLCFILSTVVSFFTCAQKPSVSLSSDSKSVQAGDLVTFTVKSNIEGAVQIDFPPEFIPGYGNSNGMEQVMDYNTGTVSTIYYFSQNGAFKENGSYTIQAFVKNKKAVYKSNKITVKVEKQQADDEISRKNCKQAVFGIIQKSKTKIYEGEAVVLEAKVYSRLNINMLEAYQNFELDGGAEVQELEKSQRLLLTRENLKGTNFLTFTYGKQLVFPNTTGKIRVRPFEMSLLYDDGGMFSDRISFTSNGSYIEVMPLPEGAPRDFIGAVGKFDLDYSIEKTKIKQGDVAELTVTISGTGNLQNINKPKLSLPKGIIIYGDPEIKEDILYGLTGAEGKVSYIYHLQFNTDQVKSLPAISISYFDPNQKKYVRVKKERIELDIKSNPNFQPSISAPVAAAQPISSENIPLMMGPSKEDRSFSDSAWFWPGVFSPLFLGFIGGLFWVRRKDLTGVIQDKNFTRRSISQLLEKLESVSYQPQEPGKAYQQVESGIKSLGNIFTKDAGRVFSKTETLQVLEENKVPAEQVERLGTILNQCEEARFSFQTNEAHFEALNREAMSVIRILYV
ncbi:MAG: hypothetical protein ACO1O6_04480 [Bacteroidota bacterium]